METSQVFYPCNPYDENGVDITLIKHMLSLSPDERLRFMDQYTKQTELLIEYGRRHREAAADTNR